MDRDVVFRYSLTAPPGENLEARGEQLVATIREHSKHHDFAQRIHVEDIAIETIAAENGDEMALLVPFHKEFFPELAVLNRYIGARAREVGLELRGLVLPDGSSVPFRRK